MGSHLAERLSEIGCDLYLLLRESSKLDNINHLSFTPVIDDLRDGSKLAEVLPDIDYIFHSAGLIKARSREEFMEVNAGGTERLANLALQHCRELKRFVYISTQAAAGPTREGEARSEVDTPQPISHYGESKLAGETALLALKDRLPFSIIRPSAVYGERDQEMLQIFQSVKAGILLKFGRQESYISIAYIGDIVEGTIRAAFMTEGIGETFFINTVDKLSQWQAQYLMADAMKVEIRPIVIPFWLLNRLAGMVESFENSQGRASMISRDKMKELRCRFWVCSSEKARSLLRFEPLLPIEESLQKTYQWYLDHRML